MLTNLAFAALGAGTAFAWLELPQLALAAFVIGVIAVLVDMARPNR